MKTFKQFAIYVLSLLVLTGCFNESEDLEKNWIEIATVQNPEKLSKFFFRLDDGTSMWAEETAYPIYKPVDGQRIIVNYSIISDKRATGKYDFDVRINDIYEVLTKDIFSVTPATQDSIGNDSILVDAKGIWVGSNYLNVEFLYLGYDKKHFINLVVDSLKTYNDDKIHLEFRHNAYNDMPVSNRWGVVSFDLRSLENHLADSVNLAIHVNLPNIALDTIFNRTYHYKTAPSAVIRKSVKNIFTNKIDADVE